MVGRFQSCGKCRFSIFAGRTRHQSRCHRSDFQSAIAFHSIRPHQAITTTEPRERSVLGKPDGKHICFRPNIPTAQLNQLPLGADQRPPCFFLVGTARTTTAEENRCGKKTDHFQQIFHIFIFYTFRSKRLVTAKAENGREHGCGSELQKRTIVRIKFFVSLA